MATIFKFLLYTPKKNEKKFTPISYIALKEYGKKDGYPLLSPQLVPAEVDSFIDSLILDLEKIRKEAKRKLTKATVT